MELIHGSAVFFLSSFLLFFSSSVPRARPLVKYLRPTLTNEVHRPATTSNHRHPLPRSLHLLFRLVWSKVLSCSALLCPSYPPLPLPANDSFPPFSFLLLLPPLFLPHRIPPVLPQSISSCQLLTCAALCCHRPQGRWNGARLSSLEGEPSAARLSLLAPKHQPHPIRAVPSGPGAQPSPSRGQFKLFAVHLPLSTRIPIATCSFNRSRRNATPLTSPRRPFSGSPLHLDLALHRDRRRHLLRRLIST